MRLTYLVWDFLIESLEGISKSLRFLILLEEHLLELADHSVEDGCRDLRGVDLRREGILNVRVTHLK